MRNGLTCTLRPYDNEDVGAILAAWESAVKVGHPFLTEEFLSQERYNIPNVYLPNTETWVVEVEGELVGFLSLMGSEVGAIFVHSEHHGTGVGRTLMDKARELRGGLELEVFKKNKVGRAFYARYGFTLMEEKHHEESGEVLMRLRYAVA